MKKYWVLFRHYEEQQLIAVCDSVDEAMQHPGNCRYIVEIQDGWPLTLHVWDEGRRELIGIDHEAMAKLEASLREQGITDACMMSPPMKFGRVIRPAGWVKSKTDLFGLPRFESPYSVMLSGEVKGDAEA